LPEDENTQDTSIVKNKGGIRVLITSPKGDILKYGVQLQFSTTNNEDKYEAILTGLRVAKSLGAKKVLLKCDSKLVIGKINDEYEIKESRMQR